MIPCKKTVSGASQSSPTEEQLREFFGSIDMGGTGEVEVEIAESDRGCIRVRSRATGTMLYIPFDPYLAVMFKEA